MKHVLIALFVVIALAAAGTAAAQTGADTVAVSSVSTAQTGVDTVAVPAAAPPPATPPPAKKATPMYYGGSIGFSFWNDYTRISVEPLVGFKLSPRLSVGGKLRYEYLNDNRSVDYTAHNLGASVFSRFRLVPALYAHGEFAYVSYDYPGGREAVPFLLLGGGYVRPLGARASLYAEVLVDVLQDENSPYEDWEPLFSVGVGVGF